MDAHLLGGQRAAFDDLLYLNHHGSAAVVDGRGHFQLGFSECLVLQGDVTVLIRIGAADQAEIYGE